jgi:hypothetical protein
MSNIFDIALLSNTRPNHVIIQYNQYIKTMLTPSAFTPITKQDGIGADVTP